MMIEVRIPWASSECMGRPEGLGEGRFWTAGNSMLLPYIGGIYTGMLTS